MKTIQFSLLSLLVALLGASLGYGNVNLRGQIQTSTPPANSGKGLVFNGSNQYASFNINGIPSGSAARTIEFWVRAVPGGSEQGRILTMGQTTQEGGTFSIFTKMEGNTNYLGFWGHNRDLAKMTALPDDQWHYVAITYDGSRIRCFLDGVLESTNNVSLNTVANQPVYIGSDMNQQFPFKGGIRDISIWNVARNQGQIQMDMVPWPTPTGTEGGRVCYLPLNEGSGNSFAALGKSLSVSTVNGATWSQAIAADPDPDDEGIWFVIQNKADLDGDTERTARRMALTVSGLQVTWAAIPLTGDYDAFLWRTIGSGPTRKIVNKKLGMGKALDCSQQNPTIGNYGGYSGQSWTIGKASEANFGTNAFILSNNFITNSKALQLNGNQISVQTKNTSDTKQVWVFQPMELALGYHIPLSPANLAPMNQRLAMPYGFRVDASNTSTEWAVLNAHLVWKNMILNITGNTGNNAVKNPNGSFRQLVMISRYDQNDFAFNYPLLQSDNPVWNQADLTSVRGGVRNNCMVTEEMMCRTGVVSRGYKDRLFREFDQVVHEFGHVLHNLNGCNANFPGPLMDGGSPYADNAESCAAATQAFYNNNLSYGGFGRTRAEQKANRRPQYDRMAEYYRTSNSWMPPRSLRTHEVPTFELKEGQELLVGEWLWSTAPYLSKSTYAILQSDGNFVIYRNGDNVFQWGSYNNLQVRLYQAKKIKMVNGKLQLLNASGNVVWQSPNAASPGARLVLGDINNPNATQTLRILDSGGNQIWTP